MSLSSILKVECPTCKKIAVEESRFSIGSSKVVKLVCGHLIAYDSAVAQSDEVYTSIKFSDGKSLRNYQIDCIKFAEENNFNIIIADEQGLGKTVELGSLLRLHPDKLLPAVVVVPGTVKRQWLYELLRICCPNDSPEEKRQFLTQVIQSGKEKALPGFQLYIVSFDMLKKEDMFDLLPDGYLKTIVIDECQRIKNHLSDRAKAVQRIAKKCEYKIPMSGTPIKNNAGEYFTVLNLVAPTRFPQYQRFIDDYCDTYESGWYQKVGGLSDIQRFHEDTKDLIIRRTKEQVKLDLPPFERRFHHVDLDPKLNKSYAKALEELDEILYSEESEFEKNSLTIAIMSRLRHITGISKVEQCVDWATEFLLSCDRKLTIFLHHQDVGLLVQSKLDEYLIADGMQKCVMLSSDLSSDKRYEAVMRFKDSDARIMIASTLAAGEGLNLQFCSDAIMLERQWNPANEEQAEARFHRFGQLSNVFVTYFIASGTIDEYFTELVEKKRAIVAGALDAKEMKWEENSLMKELALMLTTKGRERWKI